MAKWYEELVQLIEEKQDEQARMILKRLEDLQKMVETEEGESWREEFFDAAKKIEEEIRELETDPKIKRGLNRKLRRISSRVNLTASNRLGELLRALREEKGYTLRQLEEMTNVTASYLYRIETGNRKAPSINVVHRLAEALEVDPSLLLEAANEGVRPAQTTHSLEHLLYASSYTVKGKPVDVETKKQLVRLMKKIHEAPKEGEDMKFAAEILACVTAYRNSLWSKNKEQES
ncbi:helix-turn-helix domain-containing protein [Geobacillus subterraneus]|uniref:HTH cro/C1-type domain-containing protein n=1 Tax=Geobacillus subterraneus TaxID=129338 RepID=A0A679FQJ0_9BACL|nr:helix-turn-helix transcriptional regulator [Geobacillus subterraneus]BBW98922.1 hypothetical protein GsuE55_37550 [Geobacillus subterraneus]